MTPPARVTRLRQTRLDRGFSQRELSDITGIPLRSLERLDRGELDDIPFRWLVNLAIALGCGPGEIAESEWIQWKPNINPARTVPRPEGVPERESRAGYRRARPPRPTSD